MRWRSCFGAVCWVGAITTAAAGQWNQWGGPNRNFVVETSGLADQWPEDGPKKLWHRALGDGYSSIVVDGGVLYTMYRKEPTAEDEFTVALDAQTGTTIWEHKNRAPLHVRPDERWGGLGPNSTPLVVGDHLFTVGSNAVMHCFNKTSGNVLWKHDLAKDFGAPFPNREEVGYSASPIAYKGMVIVTVGCRNEGSAEGAQQSLVAFDQSTGNVIWKNLDSITPLSSPILIRFRGEDQLVVHASPGIVGVDPSSGRLLWSHALGEQRAIPTPVWNGNELVFCSIGPEGAVGSVVKLAKGNGKTVPAELWSSRKVRVRLSTPVSMAERLYVGTEQGVLAVEMSSGKRDWLARGFPSPSYVYGDGKLIILDQDGNMSLATPTPEKLAVHSKCKVTELYSLTTPTLVGTTLYVRDRKHIMAFDLAE